MSIGRHTPSIRPSFARKTPEQALLGDADLPMSMSPSHLASAAVAATAKGKRTRAHRSPSPVRHKDRGKPVHAPTAIPTDDHERPRTEAQLIQRLKDGDQTAARTLYEAHVDRIFRLCYRFAGEYDLAQDCTQEAFVRAFTKIAKFRGESAFGTWIAAIATNVSLTEIGRVKRFRERHTELDERTCGTKRARSLEPDLRTDLHRAIECLPERCRTVFLLHDLEGYTHAEIGTILGIEAGTSKSQLFRARRKLRKELDAYSGEWAS